MSAFRKSAVHDLLRAALASSRPCRVAVGRAGVVARLRRRRRQASPVDGWSPSSGNHRRPDAQKTDELDKTIADQCRRRCQPGRDPAAARRAVRDELLVERRRLPAAAGGDQRPAGAARAPRRPQGSRPSRTRHRRTAGADGRKGRDQCLARHGREPVDPHQRPDHQDRDMRRDLFTQPSDQALRHRPTRWSARSSSDRQRRRTNLYRARSSSWLRFVVQFKLHRCWRRPSWRWLRPPCSWSADGGCSAGCSKPTRRSRIRPISAACRSRSGRRCCRRWRSASSSLVASTLLQLFTTCCAAISAMFLVALFWRHRRGVLRPPARPMRCCRRDLPNWRLIAVEIGAGPRG